MSVETFFHTPTQEEERGVSSPEQTSVDVLRVHAEIARRALTDSAVPHMADGWGPAHLRTASPTETIIEGYNTKPSL